MAARAFALKANVGDVASNLRGYMEMMQGTLCSLAENDEILADELTNMRTMLHENAGAITRLTGQLGDIKQENASLRQVLDGGFAEKMQRCASHSFSSDLCVG